MIRRSLPAVTAVLIFGASLASAADPAPPPPTQGWSGKGEVGYVMSRGNTDTDSANAKIDLADLIGDWKHSIHLEGLYGRSNEVTAAERWAALLQTDLKFTPRSSKVSRN